MKLTGVEKVIKYPANNSGQPLVSVCVQTYNHEPYIEECLVGILSQQTTFEYEILLGEDNSSDKTREICMDIADRYPDKIRLFLHDRSNVIYMGETATGRYNFLYNLKSAKGKYLAICEGDDYWTDNLKLQKQVDYLEKNPDYGLIHTDNSNIFQNSNKVIKSHKTIYYPNPPSGFVFEDLLRKNFISTLTVMVKTDVMIDATTKALREMNNDLIIDYSYWLGISRNTKLKYLDEITGVYRVLKLSISHQSSWRARRGWLNKIDAIKLHYIRNLTSIDLRYAILNDILSDRLEIQFRKDSYEKEFVFDVRPFRSKSIRKRLLHYLYRRSSSRIPYLLMEFPYALFRKAQRISRLTVHN